MLEGFLGFRRELLPFRDSLLAGGRLGLEPLAQVDKDSLLLGQRPLVLGRLGNLLRELLLGLVEAQLLLLGLACPLGK